MFFFGWGREHEFLAVPDGLHAESLAQRVVEELEGQSHDAVLHEPGHETGRADDSVGSHGSSGECKFDALSDGVGAGDLGGVHEEGDLFEGHADETHDDAEGSYSHGAVGDQDGFFEFGRHGGRGWRNHGAGGFKFVGCTIVAGWCIFIDRVGRRRHGGCCENRSMMMLAAKRTKRKKMI